jgi:histidinol-phosphate aminotransferase
MQIVNRIRRPSPSPYESVRAGRNEYIQFSDPNLQSGDALYPNSEPLIRLLSKQLKCKDENLLLGLGAESLIKDIFISAKFQSKINSIYIPNNTYFMYEIYAKVFGFSIKKYDIENFYNELRHVKSGLIILINPPSPIGTENSFINYVKLLSSATSKKIFLVDEVYYGFGEKTLIKEVKKNEFTVLVRSLSKAYGLAGLRVGYCYASGNIYNQLNSIRLANEVPEYSIRKAIKVLTKEPVNFINKKARNVVLIREKAKKQLKKLGFEVLDSKGNSLSIRLNKKIIDNKSILIEMLCINKIFINTNYIGRDSGVINFTTTNKSYVNKIIKILIGVKNKCAEFT